MNLNNPLFRLNPFLIFSSLYCMYESVLWVQQTISIQFKMINLTFPVTVSSLFDMPQNLILPFLLTSPCVYEVTIKKKLFSRFWAVSQKWSHPVQFHTCFLRRKAESVTIFRHLGHHSLKPGDCTNNSSRKVLHSAPQCLSKGLQERSEMVKVQKSLWCPPESTLLYPLKYFMLLFESLILVLFFYVYAPCIVL